MTAVSKENVMITIKRLQSDAAGGGG